MLIFKIFCYSYMRSIYCKFSRSKIEPPTNHPPPTKKNNFYSTTTQKRSKKAPLKIQYFKKTLKKKPFY